MIRGEIRGMTIKEKQKSVTQIIKEVRAEICDDICKHVDECIAAFDEGRDYPCPLDRL